MDIDIEKVFKYYDFGLALFVVGYFILYIVYSNIFLNHDLLTRIVLSLSVSLLCYTPALMIFNKFLSSDSAVVRCFHKHSFFIILIFTIIELYDFDVVLQSNPRLYLPIIFLVFIIDVVIAKQD